MDRTFECDYLKRVEGCKRADGSRNGVSMFHAGGGYSRRRAIHP